jgi:hypothetical protein
MLAADKVAVFAQSPTQGADLGLEVAFLDGDARPDARQQLLFD